MFKNATGFWRDEKGANLFEYVLLVAFALTVVVAIRALYSAISNKFSDAAAQIEAIH